jgi:hypothetical protein
MNYSGTGNPRTFSWIPENFEGVKILQKFSFINPIGYTPTASIDTMRAIDTDKIWLDSIFDLYGLESYVTIAIYKLNATATDYVIKATFRIDFESYLKFDYYSEFALKSVSCIDQYNEMKSTAKNFTGVAQLVLPTSQVYINYISVKKDMGGINLDGTGYIDLIENEDSKVYNDDVSIFPEYKVLYKFDRGIDGPCDIAYIASGNMVIRFSSSSSATVTIKVYRANGDAVYTDPIITLATKAFVGNSTTVLFDVEKTIIRDFAFTYQDFLFIGIEVTGGLRVTRVIGSLSTELYVETEVLANQFSRKIPYLTAETILNEVFNDQITIETALKSIGVTSSQSILKRLNYISLIPKDFMTDFCVANGAILNFKTDGTVDLAKISTYFETLLDKDNAIEVTYFQNVEIGADTTLNFASVSAGMEQKEYQVYTYLNNWNKILTFLQSGRAASENLNLALTKFRVDYSGILDYVNKMSSSSTDTSTDLFLFDPAFTPRSTDEGFIYDQFTPRDILTNWRTFLEFCFYNYGFDALELSANGGDDFDLEIEPGYHQFDNFTLSGDNPRILPIKISFSCLISDTDFTESILKINHNSVDLYIFVTEAETTDNLEEQKIKGNLIYFPEPA